MMLQAAEERARIGEEVGQILVQFPGEDSAPLVREFQRHVDRALEVGKESLAAGEQEKREVLDAIKTESPLPFSSVDVCGVWLVAQFTDSVIFCDSLIGSADAMLSSYGHQDANCEILVGCRKRLIEQQQQALEAFREIARHWPWLRREKLDEARAYFESGGKGIPLEAVLDGLQD